MEFDLRPHCRQAGGVFIVMVSLASCTGDPVGEVRAEVAEGE